MRSDILTQWKRDTKTQAEENGHKFSSRFYSCKSVVGGVWVEGHYTRCINCKAEVGLTIDPKNRVYRRIEADTTCPGKLT